jgi:hypothetical protein
MKKIGVCLLCLIALNGFVWGQKPLKPTRIMSGLQALRREAAFHPASFAKELPTYVLRAMNNTVALKNGAKLYYARKHVPLVREALKEMRPVAAETLQKPLTYQEFGNLLFSAKAGEFFGPAFLIKSEDAKIQVAMPMRKSLEITLNGKFKALPPLTYVTLGMYDSQHVPLLTGQEQPLPLHQLNVEGIKDIHPYAFTPREVASYALDPKSSLFIRHTGRKISYTPRQRMLYIDERGLWILRPEDALTLKVKKDGSMKVVLTRAMPYWVYKMAAIQ